MANKGLGRGFASLMGLNDVEELTSEQSSGGEVMLDIAEIDPNFEQPRKISTNRLLPSWRRVSRCTE